MCICKTLRLIGLAILTMTVSMLRDHLFKDMNTREMRADSRIEPMPRCSIVSKMMDRKWMRSIKWTSIMIKSLSIHTKTMNLLRCLLSKNKTKTNRRIDKKRDKLRGQVDRTT
jgi:hypothetical protein